jgi:hypothetical protein
MTTDEFNFIDSYEIAILPEGCGMVNNAWWHKHLERRFDEPLDALVFSEEILHALYVDEDCPCGEHCAFNSKTELNPEIREIFEKNNQEEISDD